MTGLHLETFLRLLRADWGAWASLGLLGMVLALLAWTSFGARRVLRKCLVLSLVAHVGLALYGSTVPVVWLAVDPSGEGDAARHDRIRQVQVEPWPDDEGEATAPGVRGSRAKPVEAFDRPREALALAETAVEIAAPAVPDRAPERPPETNHTPGSAPPDLAPPEVSPAEARTAGEPEKESTAPPLVAPGGLDEVEAAVPRRAEPRSGETLMVPAEPGERLRADRGEAIVPRFDLSMLGGAPQLAAPTLRERVEPRPAGAAEAASGDGDAAPPELTAPKGADEAAPQVMRTAPAPAPTSGLPLDDLDLRERGRRAGPGSSGSSPFPPRRAPSPATRPPLALARVDFGPPLTLPARVRSRAPAPAADVPAPSRAAHDDPSRSGVETEVVTRPATAEPRDRAALPDPDLLRPSRPEPAQPSAATSRIVPRRADDDARPLALARVTPSGAGRLPDLRGTTGGRPLADIPEVYRSRLDPNRSVLAGRAGATADSEQAVERALDWLKRHQDADGRWDAATARFDDGVVKKGDDDFTVHCPPGETCFGECLYWEADTGLTGLALLAFLGAGYTHADGKYADTVGKGIDFLIHEQKPDGDLRGPSKAVGLYCHAMAALALCEAYALSGDERLRIPVERATAFLVRARARDGMSWRYSPGDPIGDTSVLGWAVLELKSARLVGVAVPATARLGALQWLDRVSAGTRRGLARYLPGKPPTPTMTAEAWVCRQFLGVGGPGPSSTEAAEFLLEHGPERDPYNLYYWYYGTLALYQHGGEPWSRWNAQVRDQLVQRQRKTGHPAGSWDPDDSPYGTVGGRIFGTALATLTLEVYYRFLRLYDDPPPTPVATPATPPRRVGARP